MSDYLWDKTGEADEEVERLEELLGSLRHQPRKFELPHDVEMQTSVRPRRTYAWAAVAAALILMVLAGAWFAVLRDRCGEGSRHAETARSGGTEAPAAKAPETVTSRPGVEASKEQPPPSPRVQEEEQQAPLEKKLAPQFARSDVESERKTQRLKAQRAASTNRRERQNRGASRGDVELAGTAEAQKPRGRIQSDIPPRRMSEQQAAKEQVMLALRLTSAQLNIVQRKTQGTSGAVGTRPAPDEQNKIR